MLTIGRGTSGKVTVRYLTEELTHASGSHTDQDRIVGRWAGKLAEDFALRGEVDNQHFERLVEGQHPHTGEQLVRHVTPRAIVTKSGKKRMTAAHRAGLDLTNTAPKSVSIAAIVGGDERIFEAHRRANEATLREVERFAQARLGGNRPAETTGKLLFASFTHTAARPDRETGFAAPNLHNHNFAFNFVEALDGKIRPFQPLEIFKAKALGTAVYRLVLAVELQKIGYQIEIDEKTGAPEIKGISREYREAASPRRREVLDDVEAIYERMRAEGKEVKDKLTLRAEAATRNRRGKAYDKAEMRQRYQELDARFGGQAHAVVREARQREREFGKLLWDEQSDIKQAREAVTYAIVKARERGPTNDLRQLIVDAMQIGLSRTTVEAIKEEVQARKDRGDLLGVVLDKDEARQIASEQMRRIESTNIELMLTGQGASTPISQSLPERLVTSKGIPLNDNQRNAVAQITTSRDRVQGLHSGVGTGKTAVLAAIKEIAEHAGFEVQGLAPTQRATRLLGESGIEAKTLHRFIGQGSNASDRDGAVSKRRLLVLDGSSTARPKGLHTLLAGAGPEDKILLVGDSRRQHAIESGNSFVQLQQHGMLTAKLEKIVRRRDRSSRQVSDKPLRQVIERLTAGEVKQAVEDLIARELVTEITDEQKRLKAIAKDYCERPGGTLIISPGDKERAELNRLVHEERQAAGQIGKREHSIKVLINRSTMNRVERTSAGAYKVGDRIRYGYASKTYGVQAGEYGRVETADAGKNTITVRLDRGRRKMTYDPKRLQSVSVYREAEIRVAEGDRVQMQISLKQLNIAKGELGTVKKIAQGRLTVDLDSGRAVSFTAKENLHLNYGYAVTSYSAKGTVPRLIINASAREWDKSLGQLTPHIALLRSREDGRIYTNSTSELSDTLNRQVSKSAELEMTKHTLPPLSVDRMKGRRSVTHGKGQSGRIPAQESTRGVGTGERTERGAGDYSFEGIGARRQSAAHPHLDARAGAGDGGSRRRESDPDGARTAARREHEHGREVKFTFSGDGRHERAHNAERAESSELEGGRARESPLDGRQASGQSRAEKARAEEKQEFADAENRRGNKQYNDPGDRRHDIAGAVSGTDAAGRAGRASRGLSTPDLSTPERSGTVPGGRTSQASVGGVEGTRPSPNNPQAAAHLTVSGAIGNPGLDRRDLSHRAAGRHAVAEPRKIADEIRDVYEKQTVVERMSREVVRLANEHRIVNGKPPHDEQVRELMHEHLAQSVEQPPTPAGLLKIAERNRELGLAGPPQVNNKLEESLWMAQHGADRAEFLEKLSTLAEAAFGRERGLNRAPERTLDNSRGGWQR